MPRSASDSLYAPQPSSFANDRRKLTPLEKSDPFDNGSCLPPTGRVESHNRQRINFRLVVRPLSGEPTIIFFVNEADSVENHRGGR